MIYFRIKLNYTYCILEDLIAFDDDDRSEFDISLESIDYSLSQDLLNGVILQRICGFLPLAVSDNLVSSDF